MNCLCLEARNWELCEGVKRFGMGKGETGLQDEGVSTGDEGSNNIRWISGGTLLLSKSAAVLEMYSRYSGKESDESLNPGLSNSITWLRVPPRNTFTAEIARRTQPSDFQKFQMSWSDESKESTLLAVSSGIISGNTYKPGMGNVSRLAGRMGETGGRSSWVSESSSDEQLKRESSSESSCCISDECAFASYKHNLLVHTQGDMITV